MDIETIFAGAVWFALGFLASYVVARNRASSDPHSLRDEAAELRRYIDEKVGRVEARIPAQPIVVQPAPAPAQPAVQTTDKVELNAQSVEVFNNRSSDDTSTAAGAKAYDDAGPGGNDAVLSREAESLRRGKKE